MKKNYFLIGSLLLTVGLFSFNWGTKSEIEKYNKNIHLNQAGAPAGATGAPGENNCTQCHGGTVQSGAGFNTLTVTDNGNPVTDYVPGETYQVTVAMNTANAKNGFQVIALDANNLMAGTYSVTDGTNTKQVGTSKKYMTHKLAGTALTTWSFDWTVPASNVGTITFYLATNQTNDNDASSGDVIRLSQHTLTSTASTKEISENYSVNIGHNTNNNSLNIVMESMITGEAHLNIVDLNGKSYQNERLGNVSKGKNGFNMLLENNLPAGTYIAHISVNNNFVTKKFVIN